MKFSLVLISLFTTLSLFSQRDNIGVGIVSINFDEQTILNFYSSSNEENLIKTIQFFNDESINSLNIKDLEQQKTWLNPETLWLDYYSFVFRCISVKDDWFEVMVDNEKSTVLWLHKSDLTEFKSWEAYLIDMFGIERIDGQKIRVSPSDNSNEIIYLGDDCFQARTMKGDWIEIFTAEYCSDDYTNSKTPIKSGWIKWREGNQLLIDYFITS